MTRAKQYEDQATLGGRKDRWREAENEANANAIGSGIGTTQASQAMASPMFA